MAPSNLKPIATRAQSGDLEGGRRGPSPAPSSSNMATPKARPVPGAELQSDSPGMGSDSSSPWRRFFRGGARYPASDADSFGNSPRQLMGFSPKASSTSQSHVSTPVKRKYGGGGGGGGSRDYGPGQITSYGGAGGNPAHGAAGAMMMSLAEELLTKKGLSLKDLTEEQEEYAETGDKVGDRAWGGGGGGGAAAGGGLGRARGWAGRARRRGPGLLRAGARSHGATACRCVMRVHGGRKAAPSMRAPPAAHPPPLLLARRAPAPRAPSPGGDSEGEAAGD
jgi:hypothetical protein